MPIDLNEHLRQKNKSHSSNDNYSNNGNGGIMVEIIEIVDFKHLKYQALICQMVGKWQGYMF